MCSSLSITTPVSLLANALHGQVRLAVVNQICVIHEAMNGYKNLEVHIRLASKMKIFEFGTCTQCKIFNMPVQLSCGH